MNFDIEFEPDDREEQRRQRFANMTDRYPDLAALMTGKTWQQIYDLTAPIIECKIL